MFCMEVQVLAYRGGISSWQLMILSREARFQSL